MEVLVVKVCPRSSAALFDPNVPTFSVPKLLLRHLPRHYPYVSHQLSMTSLLLI
jgi:hypothetical protein